MLHILLTILKVIGIILLVNACVRRKSRTLRLAEGYYGIPETELIQATGLDIDGADAEGILAQAMDRI